MSTSTGSSLPAPPARRPVPGGVPLPRRRLAPHACDRFDAAPIRRTELTDQI
ncbi:hypothetical protein [Streptomyces yanii]|uniref:hypothetical protein n=1 Tax=Streptomyces yanii TaxID=78510 RepID=UPI003CD09C1F